MGKNRMKKTGILLALCLMTGWLTACTASVQQSESQDDMEFTVVSEDRLPEELKESKAGRIIDKVVTGASAILQGTGMLSLSGETRDITGGLILRDGNVEVNCAFETQLRVLRETMAADIAAILFA